MNSSTKDKNIGRMPALASSGAARPGRLLAYLRPYRKEFAIALFCMVLFGATDGGVPFLVKTILDGVFKNQDRTLLQVLPILLVGFAVLRAVLDFLQQFLMARIGHNIVRDMRNQLNAHLLTLSSDFYLVNSSANLLSRITSDVLLLRGLLTDSVASIIRDTIRVVALLIAAVYLDPFLALIAFVVFPIGVFPVYRYGRRMRKLSKVGQDAIGRISGILQETIVGHRVVKVFGQENYERERFEAENQKLNAVFVKAEKIKAMTGPINEILATLAIAGIILYGGWSVIGGVRSQGDFIAFLLSVFLLYDPFKRLSRVNSIIAQGLSGADRIFEVLDTRPSIVDPVQPVKLAAANTIEFEGVNFTYPGADVAALSDLSLTIEEGHKVALVGFSGAGKSTVVDLIARFIDPVTGVVRIGGTDISTVTLADLRSRIALVGQHTFLFNDTIFKNIHYGNPAASAADVEQAARAAFAYDFIVRLPAGFETQVGESGMSLSGGERQRIAIARAILKNAPILILDEATASLDNRSEREVQSAIQALEQGRTTVVVAHRLSTVRDADMIVVLKEGRIVETGRHAELLSIEGEYSRLYALQFASEGEGQDELIIN
jgi:subfamily B ATP-binding cassette protein MsbA